MLPRSDKDDYLVEDYNQDYITQEKGIAYAYSPNSNPIQGTNKSKKSQEKAGGTSHPDIITIIIIPEITDKTYISKGTPRGRCLENSFGETKWRAFKLYIQNII